MLTKSSGVHTNSLEEAMDTRKNTLFFRLFKKGTDFASSRRGGITHIYASSDIS